MAPTGYTAAGIHPRTGKNQEGAAGATGLMRTLLIPVMAAALLGGCSIKKTIVNYAGDAIGGGGSVWSSDEDPQLVKEALPFGLKTNESLLEVSPEHEGLLEATATGFLAYALMVKDEADRIEAGNLQAARKQRARASKLFIRGRDYALRALELRYPGFADGLKSDRKATLGKTRKDDATFLYLAGAGWAGALGADTGNLGLVAEFPTAGALVQRVLELDDGFRKGAAHEFMVSYEAGRPGGSTAAARKHYDRALELSGGKRASVYLALAEAVSVEEQDVNEFRDMLKAARAVDVNKEPDDRLLNVIAQERAEWLRTRIPDLFLLAN